MKTQDQNSVKPDTQSCQMAVSGSVTVRDLRIGNYIKIKEDSFHFYEILQINRGSICIEDAISDEFESVDIVDVEPIKISKEWLKKLGFVKKDKIWSDKSVSKNLFFKENYFIEFTREGILFCQLHYSGDAWFLKNMEYIHQLQNLYFDLKSSDLQLVVLTDR